MLTTVAELYMHYCAEFTVLSRSHPAPCTLRLLDVALPLNWKAQQKKTRRMLVRQVGVPDSQTRNKPWQRGRHTVMLSHVGSEVLPVPYPLSACFAISDAIRDAITYIQCRA